MLYRAGVRARNAGYDAGLLRQTRLPCPVISVGNLTVGGQAVPPTWRPVYVFVRTSTHLVPETATDNFWPCG